MPATLSDAELLLRADRLKGQTVVITGGANGIGRGAALEMARRGANIVIGDIDSTASAELVVEITEMGSKAVSANCNVLEHKDQVALFELAMSTFGRVDVVIPSAGVTEIGRLTNVRLTADGLPMKPLLKTLEINLVAVTYTTQLAYYYINKNRNSDSLKSLVLVASMGAFSGIPGASLYAASKHGLIGMMRSLKNEFDLQGMRIVAVCPWFVDTPLIANAGAFKTIMTGIPMAPLQRVVDALILAATEDKESSGSAYTIPDDGEVYKIAHMEFEHGVYKQLGDRIKRLQSVAQNIRTCVLFTKLFFRSALGKLLLGGVVGSIAYRLGSQHGLIH